MFGGVIGGAIVDDDDFEARVVLCRKGREALANLGRSIQSRHDNREDQLIFCRRGRLIVNFVVYHRLFHVQNVLLFKVGEDRLDAFLNIQ